MSDAGISLLILAICIALFVWNRLPVEIVALATALATYATGLLDVEQALAGFGSPVVLFLGALFVVSEGIDSTGVTAWAGQKLMGAVGERPRSLLVLMMAMSAVLSALISPNGAVAAVLPMSVVVATHARVPPSRKAMPLAFAASAGSLLMLTGTPVNLLVSEAATQAGVGGFGFFEFGLIGVPLVIGTIVLITIIGPRVLPLRTSLSGATDLSGHARTLGEHYGIEPGALAVNRELGVAEIVIPPRSDLIGVSVSPGTKTRQGLVVLAVQRLGRSRTGRTVLDVGDAMLVQGPWEALAERADSDDVLVVDSPELIRRQAVPMGPRAKRAIVILVALIVLLALDVVPAAVAGIVAASAMVLSRAVRVSQAYRSISWSTLLLIGGLIPLSTAIQETGGAAMIADLLIGVVGDAGPYALMVGIFVLIGTLGQVVSNMATALIVLPIAVAAANEMGVSPRPVLMLVTVAAAASFLTPIATPANMMAMGPGGYRFGDYWKLGLPLMVWFLLVATLLIPVIWPFAR